MLSAKGQATLLENIRFEVGETDDDAKLSQRLAKNVDVYCLDAFATAHRAHASTHGMVKYVDEACAGLLPDEGSRLSQQNRLKSNQTPCRGDRWCKGSPAN